MDPNRHNQADAGEDLKAPPKLAAAVAQLQPRRVFVPPSLDSAVLHAAHRHLRKLARTRACFVGWRWFWPALATACVLIVAITLAVMKPAQKPAFARADLNQDGRVDILDAFQLARQVNSGGAPPLLDLNGDGVTDRRDVEAIAAQAVKLEKGGRS